MKRTIFWTLPRSAGKTAWMGKIHRETLTEPFFEPSPMTEPLPWWRRLFLWFNHRWPRLFGVRCEETEE